MEREAVGLFYHWSKRFKSICAKGEVVQVGPAQILIIEDTLSLAMLQKSQLEKYAHRVDIRDTATDALFALQDQNYDLIILDLGLPDMDGLALLSRIKDQGISSGVIVSTADASRERAVEAMQLGALDYLVKPVEEARLLTTVRNALDRKVLGETVDSIQQALPKHEYHGFIGRSVAMQAVYSAIANVASSKATVFITGESGTGKEVTAEAIHKAGPRSSGPFVPLNCGAIPRELIESELFGHKKGSFTGAIADKEGVARQAHGGTLFLDEICEMELDLQTKLLRFLQTETIQPVGATRLEKVDVRVICATNRNPYGEVQQGRFREDLYYRLNVVPIELPPLRARDEDIVELAEFFLDRFAKEEDKHFRGFSPEAIAHLKARLWPGNVRELQNLMRQLTVMLPGGLVDINHIPAEPPTSEVTVTGPSAKLTASGTMTSQFAHAPAVVSGFERLFDHGRLEELERLVIEHRISQCGGSIPQAAKSLGVSPSTIYRKKEQWERDGLPTDLMSESV